MTVIARLFALVGLLFVAGCAASDPPNLSVAEIGGLKLASVQVTFQPDAFVNYTPAETELAQTKGVALDDGPAIEALVKSPEGTAFIRQRASDRIRAAMLNEVGPVMSGARPVRLEVQVKRIDIPSTGRNIATALLFGSHDATVNFRATVLDARTGAPLIDGHDLSVLQATGGGLVGLAAVAALEASGAVDSPYDRLVRTAAKQYARWLNPGTS